MAYLDILLKVKAAIAPYLERAGYVFVDLRLYRDQAGRQVLEVLADRPDGGITLDECGVLSREINEFLEGEGVLPGRALLDVSSPGIDRPLVLAADFRRAKGRRIRVFLSAPVAERIEHCGILEEVGEVFIRLTLSDPSAQAPGKAGSFRSGCRRKGGKKGPADSFNRLRMVRRNGELVEPMPAGLHKTIEIPYDKINKAKQVI